MGKKSFLKGAAILGIAGLVVQVMGAVFRIPLGNIIGADGMGYYQTAYPIYIFLLIFSTNGAPAAISKMTSERIAVGNYREAHRVFRLSFILMTAFGLVAFSSIFFGAEYIVAAVKNPGAYYAMVTIAPALLLIPLMSVYRGYFQGMQEMGATATSQLAEQAVRVAVGLTLAVVLLPKGLEAAAAGATAGTSVGPVFGIIVLVIIYLKNKNRIFTNIEGDISKAKESGGSILKNLAYIAIPITIGVSIMPIINLGDLLLVMRRLQDIGYTEDAANVLYGQLTGMVLPIVNIPMALALAMALSMVPAVAAAKATNDTEFLQVNIRLGLRTSMIIGVPCALGLMALAEPIMLLLYPLQRVDAVNSAGCLFILGAGVIFLCVAQTMAGILQGLGRPAIAVYGIGASFAVKCIGSYVLTAIPSLNIEGAAIASVLGFLTIGAVNFIAVKKLTGITYNWNLAVVKPFVSGIAMFVVVVGVYKITAMVIPGSLATVLAIGAGVCTYGFMLLKIKAISADEILLLPKGHKLATLLKRLRLI